MKNTVKTQIEGKNEYLYFGSYPQSIVIDGNLISELTKIVKDKPSVINSNGFTSYRYYYGMEVDKKVTPTNDWNYMWYKDITYNSNTYRCVYFSSYRPKRTIEKLKEENDARFSKNNYYFFKFEPIKWKVITKNNNDIVLVSNQILDSQCFNIMLFYEDANETNIYPNNYAKSFIRSWLNSIFIDTAFSIEEYNTIQYININNTPSTTSSPYSDYRCSNTYDKVFLLSYEEAYKTFNLTYEERSKTSTDYAVCQGVIEDKWWLRSACPDNDKLVSIVIENGEELNSFLYEDEYFDLVDSTINGIVPAICLKTLNDEDEKNDTFSIKFYDNKGRRLFLKPFYYEIGSTISLPHLGIENFRFVGWYDGKNIINAITKDMAYDLELRPRFEATQKVRDYINNNKMYYREGSNIYFGSYPQTLVTDDKLERELIYIVKNRYDEDDFISYKYYIKSEPSDYMSYLDIEYDGERYRCVLFDKFRIENIDEDDDYDTLDTHEFVRKEKMEKIYLFSNEYYFYKFERVKWNIIEETSDSLTIMSDLVLDSQDYNHFSYLNENNEFIISNNYEKSSIRHWLNDYFYNNAFNEYEQELINTIEINNNALSTGAKNNKNICNNTFDKVWLLSYEEAFSKKYNYVINKKDKVTDYALIQGLSWHEKVQGCSIWLRSPNSTCVDESLVVFNEKHFDSYSVKDTDLGVVPLLNIKLK